MATLRKRGAYQWEAQVRRRGYPATSKTFETKVEAEAWASMIESEMSRGVWVSRSEGESTSLLELLDRYEREITPYKKGQAQEVSVLRVWRATPLAARVVATIRGVDMAKVRDQWLVTHESSTVLRRLSLLSHVFNVARKEWGFESVANPVELIRKPVVANARTRRVEVAGRSEDLKNTSDEVEWVIRHSGSIHLPAIVRLAVETAMRRSEIAGLCWKNIDLERRVAHLPSTKNGSARDVPLSSRAVAVLASLLHMRDQGVAVGDARVFDVRADAITRAFERAVARARAAYMQQCEHDGVEPALSFLTDLRFHDLRHEAASRMAEIYQLHELAKITGHKDPRMLMRYYHPRAEDLAKKLG
jgi:integrase